MTLNEGVRWTRQANCLRCLVLLGLLGCGDGKAAPGPSDGGRDVAVGADASDTGDRIKEMGADALGGGGRGVDDGTGGAGAGGSSGPGGEGGIVGGGGGLGIPTGGIGIGTGGAGTGGAGTGGAPTGGAGTGGSATGGAGTGGSATGGAGTGGSATGGAGTGGAGTGGAGTGGAPTGGAGTGGAGTGGGAIGGAGTGGSATGGAGTGGSATGGAATGGAAAGGNGGTNSASFNTIFVTSTEFTLDELAAKGGGGTSGPNLAAAVLKGADVACAEAVSAAGSLAPSGKYVAWISSAETDARDRLKAAANGVLPRGWIRVDGRPFLNELPADDTAIPAVLYPPNLDEKGAIHYTDTFTATDVHGRFTPTASCSNWNYRSTSSTIFATAGLPIAGAAAWTFGWNVSCSDHLSVYCMQVNHFDAIPRQPPPANAKRVFLHRGYDPSTGLAAADNSCNVEAASAGLTGTFRALMAPNGASAASRFHPGGTRAFVRSDGVVVAAKDTDLFAGGTTVIAPICVSARGDYVDGTVYTGAVSVETVASLNCQNWSTSANSSSAYMTFASLSGVLIFQQALVRTCDLADSIFCVED